MVRQFGICAGLAVCLISSSAFGQCPELLQNNEFSLGSWQPWEVDISAPSATVDMSVSEDEWQTLDGFIIDSSEEGALVEVSQTLLVQEGRNHLLSFYIYTSNAARVRIRLSSADSPSNTYGLDEEFLSSASAWDDTLEYPFEATASDPDAKLTISFEPHLSTSLYFKLDSLFLSEVDCSTSGTGGASSAGGTGGASSAGGTGGASNAGGTGGASSSGGSGGGVGANGGTGGSGTSGTDASGGDAASGTGGLSNSVGTSAEGSGGSGAGGAVVAGAGGAGGDSDASSEGSGGGAPSEVACAPGLQISCACLGGENGVQVCRDDGQGYGECSCVDSEAEPVAGDDGGCGCKLSASSPAVPWSLLVTLAPALLIVRRARESGVR